MTSYFFDESTGFLVERQEIYFLKTTNGGTNISVLSTGNSYNINSITFINTTTGYIAGGSSEKIFMKTTNGGNNWTTNKFRDSIFIKRY